MVALGKRPATLAILFLSTAIAGPAFADCAPAKLVRIVTSLDPRGKPATFVHKPTIQYRLGNGRLRTELQPNPEKGGAHFLVITDAPMTWLIELTTKTGFAKRDTHVPSVLHASIFDDEELPEEIRALEYGCEADFIASPGTIHERVISTTAPAIKHSVVSGKWKATLFVEDGSDVPSAAVLSEFGRVVLAIRYHSYEILEHVPDGLFAPPAGIKIK